MKFPCRNQNVQNGSDCGYKYGQKILTILINMALLFILTLLYLAGCEKIIGATAPLGDPEDCRHTNDACPVWNGWSDPKCHVDDNPAGCQNGVCWKYACTYCAAKAFGCSTNLKGGCAGTIVGFEQLDNFNCQTIQRDSDSAFSLHCGCGGACSFHSNWRIYYRPFIPPATE